MKINKTKEISSRKKYMLDAFYDDRQFFVVEVDGSLYIGLENDSTLCYLNNSSNIVVGKRIYTAEEYIIEDPTTSISTNIDILTKKWNRHYKAEMKRYEKE